MNDICIKMASEMLEVSPVELDTELVRRLLRINELIKKVSCVDAWDGGVGLCLRSRQIVATIVEQWEREKDEKLWQG